MAGFVGDWSPEPRDRSRPAPVGKAIDALRSGGYAIHPSHRTGFRHERKGGVDYDVEYCKRCGHSSVSTLFSKCLADCGHDEGDVLGGRVALGDLYNPERGCAACQADEVFG